jgi:hypothetical protein
MNVIREIYTYSDSEFKEMYGILNRQHLVHLQTIAATGGIGGYISRITIICWY